MIAGGKVSRSFINSIRTLTYQLQVIQRSQGDNGLILYLKASQIALQQACAGYLVKDMRSLGARVSRTKGTALPRLIPASHRKIINNNLLGKYLLIKFYLTLFYCYRVIGIDQYTLKLNTITDKGIPFDMETWFPTDWTYDFLEVFIKHKGILLDPTGYFRRFQRMFTILRSSPNNLRYEFDSLWSTHPLVMWRSFAALRASSLYDIILKWSHNFMPNLFYLHNGFKTVFPRQLGKLSFKMEAAGKLRVFALVDNFTQWVLYPLHKVIFMVLRSIPMDGTFDQMRPIKRLIGLNVSSYYSLDLSAATDRLPLSIQKRLLNFWIRALPGYGDDWARLLVGRMYNYVCPTYADPGKNPKVGRVRYAVGQPMGALSSWAMLALTHHFIVQVAS